MSRTTKRFLSMLLAAAMLLSLGITGWAIDDGDITIVDPETEAARQTDKHVTEGFDEGTELELKEIDPDTLPIERLGEIEEDDILVAEELPFGLNDIVRVSIVLDKPSTMAAGYATQNIVDNRSAMNYRETLRRQQASVEAAIASAGVSMDVKWNLTLAVNIISAEVRYGDIETIEAVSGVKKVFLENRYEPQVDEVNTSITTEYMVGAAQVWANGYTGAGTRVAIVDTGTNQDHLSFSAEALEYALEKDGLTPNLLAWADIEAVKTELNANTHKNSAGLTEEVYKNTKIPYAYNYIDGGYITDHDSDSQGEHGSHVSGIAAANRFVKIDGEFVDAAEKVYAVGVAPDAQILTMKVFGKGGGAYDSDYMAAIEDAIVLKADSVNLSLGSGQPGYTFSDEYQDVMDSLVECGTVVSISAGNSYNWASYLPSGVPYLYLEDVSLHTGGSPGTYVNSLCVAAAENVGKATTPLFFNGDQKVIFTETSGYGNAPMATIAGEYEYVLIDGPGVDDNANVGKTGDAFFALGSEVVEGKLALCYRGSSSFFAKANAAAGQGAVGTVIINNTDGVINMNLTDYKYSAPCVSILKVDGDAIKAASEAVKDDDGNVLYYKGTVKITADASIEITTERKDANITPFSSWGVPGSLIMKPEITAPGGDIYSVNGMTDDEYEFMSGTSMAAPHITGMAALVSQYVKETELDKATGQNSRTLVNSLMMSTATPMIVDGAYLSILQQGSGLGDISLATQAKSYILMGEDATASWKDGKVKAELGDDPSRKGEYSYSFSVNNFSDVDLAYELSTDLFTQWVAGSDGQGNLFMDTATESLVEGEDYVVKYDFAHIPLSGHDVNKDGNTDEKDVQAILDCLTGLAKAEDLDLEAGEMDGAAGLSSYDAELLLNWLGEQGYDKLVVPAGQSVSVKVNITYTDDLKAFLDYYFTKGSWIEGFTYVTPTLVTREGENLDVEHSIPILGFYGSFTDPSMFDCVDPISAAYGSTKVSYTGNANTNYLTINTGKGNKIFMGNPYAVEDEFPAERLAISPDTKLVSFRYNQIRNSAANGVLITNDDYEILKDGIGAGANGAWYYVNGQTWYDTTTQTANINTKVKDLGFGALEGSEISVEYFAVPEYYGMLLHPTDPSLTGEEVNALRRAGYLGDGASIGYTFRVDNTTPTAKAKMNWAKDKITVTAQDDNYIAYIGIMDISGNTVYAGEVPEQTMRDEEVEVTFDVSGLEMPNGVAIFVGDYAGNERAYLVVFDPDEPVTATKSVYLLTDTLEAGKDYIIASSNAAGAASVLVGNGASQLTSSAVVNVVEDDIGVYIPAEDTDPSFTWTSAAGIQFTNDNDGSYLGYYTTDYPYACWSNPGWADDFSYANNLLTISSTRGMYFSSGYFMYGTPDSVYLYVKTEVEYEMDTENASAVTVTPEGATLILDVIPTVELQAVVEPIVLHDLSVTWTSSDETVATVDANGLVTAVGPGSAVITASSNQTPSVTDSAVINVTAGEPLDAVVYGNVAFGKDDVQYGAIDLSDMSVTNLSGDAMFSYFYGGGRSGDYIYGNDVDNDFHRYNAEDAYAYDSDFHFTINSQVAVYDLACFPAYSIADYSNVTEQNPDPAVTDYAIWFSSVGPNSILCYFKEDGRVSYFDLADLGAKLVAVTFVGGKIDEETGLPNWTYLLLLDNGSLVVWTVYPVPGSGGLSANYNDEFAQVGVITFGDDPTAFSMSYLYDDKGTEEETDDAEYVLIADNSVGGIYYVDLSEIDSDGNVDAHFAGKIDGATSLTSLSDFYLDTIGPIGTVEIGKTDGNAIVLPELPAFARDCKYGTTALESQEFTLLEKESDDDIVIGEDEGDIEINVVGGLNAVRTQAAAPRTEQLQAAELINPDYDGDGGAAIALTLPDADEAYFNGFATVEYDPEVMSLLYNELDAKLDYVSISIDEDAGMIKIAFAGKNALDPEAIYGYLVFSAPTADTEVTVTTKEANDNLDVNDVSVIPFTSPFELSDEEITVPAQSTYELSVTGPKNVTWSSSDEKVATVDENGKIFANLYGTAIITVTDGTRTRTCTVHVLFSDVVNPSYYFAPVYWAAEQGITKGYESGKDIGKFGVGFNCQRRELLIFLWRYAGEPTVDKDGNPYGNAQDMFNDLGSYGPTTATNKAIAWACTEGITKGYSDGGFHPKDPIERKDVMILLYRLAGRPSVTGTLDFPDCQSYKPGTDTYNAILWGSQNEITKGYSDGTFGPRLNCLREQIVTFLYRYDNLD